MATYVTMKEGCGGTALVVWTLLEQAKIDAHILRKRVTTSAESVVKEGIGLRSSNFGLVLLYDTTLGFGTHVCFSCTTLWSHQRKHFHHRDRSAGTLRKRGLSD